MDMFSRNRVIEVEESGNKYFVEKYLLKKNYVVEKQMRALYECREIYKDDIEEMIRILVFALNNNDSVLLRHEIAYVLGQISNEKCNDILISLLSDEHEHVMVRHEAAEGLAAVGSESSIEIIKKFVNDKFVEVRETCELALCALLEKNKKVMCACVNMNPRKNNVEAITGVSEKMKEKREEEEEKEEEKEKIGEEIEEKRQAEKVKEDEKKKREIETKTETETEIDSRSTSRFLTIDPVVITSTRDKKSIKELIEDLFNENLSLKYRYEALFELRNLESAESINAICNVLLKDSTSAIFRHEVAFVLGQLVHLDSVNYLIKSLENKIEHEMVRHEAALALGSLGSLNLQHDEYIAIREKILKTLKAHSKDLCRVVAESCLVGLDYIAESLNTNIEIC